MKSNSKSGDTLLKILSEMQKFCEEQQLLCFYTVPGSNEKSIFWDITREPEWQTFLRLAKALLVKVVYLRVSYLTESHIEEGLTEEGDDPKEIETLRNKV